MTIEEKLQHFYDTSVKEARGQAEKDVQEPTKNAWMPYWKNIKKKSLVKAARSKRDFRNRLWAVSRRSSLKKNILRQLFQERYEAAYKEFKFDGGLNMSKTGIIYGVNGPVIY